jgi:FtsZ-binding cell division protein ZapB
LQSNVDRPELRALGELEAVISHIAEELSAWRRRALKAETQRTDVGSGHDVVGARERILELEQANAGLQERLAAARERLEHLLGRLQFLEDQVAGEGQPR